MFNIFNLNESNIARFVDKLSAVLLNVVLVLILISIIVSVVR